jgi:hypothetical protein
LAGKWDAIVELSSLQKTHAFPKWVQLDTQKQRGGEPFGLIAELLLFSSVPVMTSLRGELISRRIFWHFTVT